MVTGSDEFGLPEYASEELLIALFHKASRDDFEARSVTAVPYELLQLMGWGTDGRAYERIKRALDQLAGVYITTNALWNAESGTFSKAGFHILDDYEFVEDADSGRTRLTVNWNERLFSIFQQSRFKRLDTGLLLRPPLAGLEAALPLARQAPAQKRPRRDRRAPPRARQAGGLALQEVHLAGHAGHGASPQGTHRRAATARGRSRTRRPTRAKSWSSTASAQRPSPPTTEHDALDALSPDQRDLYDALADRGLSADAARTLVVAQDADAIRRQVRHFDHLVASGEPPKSSGWIVAAVEKDFGLPPALLARDKSHAGPPERPAPPAPRSSALPSSSGARRPLSAPLSGTAIRARLNALTAGAPRRSPGSGHRRLRRR